MGISGSTVAPLYALSGIARAGAIRSCYTSSQLFVSVNGVQFAAARPDPTNRILYDAGLTIVEVLNETPNTAGFTVQGIEPFEGQDVVMTFGSINNYDRLFAGTILNRSHAFVGTPANWNAPVNAIDYTWHLTRRRFSGSYTNAAPALIAADIVAAVPGFTLFVQPGLANLDAFSQTDVTALAALVALAKRVGGYCDVDAHKVVKLFTTDTVSTNPVTLTSAHSSLSEFSFTKDLSQVRTRIFSEGAGGSALTLVAPGETIMPLSLIAWYNPAGGMVKSGTQHITYTGVTVGGGGSLIGPGASPAAAPALALAIGTGLGAGTYQYAYTDITPSGESLPSPLGTITTGLLAAPAIAPTSVIAAGTGLGTGTYQYAYTDVTAAGETLPSPLATVAVGTLAPDPSVGSARFAINGDAGTNPFAGGDLERKWACTFTTAAGETLPTAFFASFPGPYVYPLSAGSFHGDLSNIPTGPAGVTGRNIYRTVSGGSQLKLVGAIADNTTSTFADRIFDGSLGANVPTTNTASLGNRAAVSVIAAGPSGTTSRNVYRTVVGGSQLKLLTTIADNVTTTYADAIADGSLGANAPTVGTALAQQVSLSGIGIGASPTTSRKVYRTAVGGSQLKLLTTLANNTATTFADSTPDGSLGANAPTGDTSALSNPSGQLLAGSSTAIVAGAGAFSPGGGWAVIGNETIRYTGITGNTLTGIPASGVGSIVATVSFNSTITAVPALTGIPASGVGAIRYTILRDDPVNVLAQVDDVPAQVALAALIGGGDDGVIEEYMQDATIGESEARARATAQLELLSTAQVSITYKSRDKNSRAGRIVTVSLGAPTNLSASFQIQLVTIDTFQPALMPTFSVQASNNRFSLEDLLRMVRAQQAA